ncbi:MAG: TOMM precursor leader peptide-binding protein [Holophaga sp.]|jgi:ribosomal protein S12 methylthiotransferase accessory factor
MLRYPTLKAHLRAGTVPGEGVILVSEEGSWTLQGALFEQVLPLLDGTRTPEQIASSLVPARPAEVYYVLEFLEKRGHLADKSAGLDAPDEAYWASLGLDPGSACKALRSARIRVRAAGAADPAPLARCLEEAGLALVGEDPTLEVALTDDYLRQDLRQWAAEAREAGLAWMVCRPLGREFWVGPLFPARADGAAAGCFGCLQHRLRRNQQVQEFLRSRNGWTDPMPTAVAALPAAVGAACRLAAVEIAKFLAGAAHNLDGKLLSMDTRSWVSKTHRLVRYPACRVCGGSRQERPGPVRLARRPAAASEGSGHRVAPPQATLDKYDHLVSPIVGIVSMVEAPPGTGGVFQVCVGGANGAIQVHSLDGFKTGFRHRSAGKGPTLVQAKASALAESLERYSSEYTGSEYQVPARLRDLGDRAIHPNAVMGFSQRQFRDREAWNARRSRFNSVPAPLDPDLEIPWSPVWSLTEEREKLMPTQFLYFTGPGGGPAPWPQCCRACSNGNAAGNNLEEAVLQGFMELVERDATAIWWYNRLARPGVDLDSFGQPYLTELAAHYRSLDRDLWALDLTHDLGIPVFAAVSCRRETQGQLLFGLGCSLDPSVALMRSCAELNQFISGIDTKAKTPLGDEETLRWLKTATLDDQPYLAPDPRAPRRRLADFTNAASGDLLEDILFCRRLVESKGMEMLTLDLTREDAGMPVAKVIVPGLRHFWARYAPGRLYDVPVAMGWRERPLAEEDLNPTPVFI